MDEFVNLKETELRLGLPGTQNPSEEKDRVSSCNKRALPSDTDQNEIESSSRKTETSHPRKTQIVGWPPVRSYRNNNIQTTKKSESDHESQGFYVKVRMDGAPYLRKIDLNCYKGYSELHNALEVMFKFSVGEYSEREGYKGSEFVPTYEDRDGDWMLTGDVPWEMFVCNCKRLRIIKGSEAKGLSCGV